MAARENQGLQIALIIFVMLTIVLAVTTYVFFSSSQEYQTKFKAAEQLASQNDTAMRTALDESNELKKLLGADAKAKKEDVQKKFAEDAKVAPELKEADQNYPKLVEFLRSEIGKKDADLAAKELTNRSLQAQLDSSTAESVAASQAYDTDKATAQQEVTQAKADVAAARDGYKSKADTVVSDFAVRRKEHDAKTQQLTGVITEREKNIQKLAGTVEEQAKIIAEKVISSANPDGKITFVNQRAKLVWVNLGTEDGLRPQTTFSVVTSGANNALTAVKKAEIEITRVLAAHLAEGRIVTDDLSDPILPGDQIFSPLFEAGKAEHFALAGFMDLDEDGRSDRERVKQLIELNGGVIDSEVTDDGKKVGEVSVKTRYLVLGDQPTDQNVSGEFRNNYSRVLSEAEQLGVKKMPFKDLLDHIGFDPRKDRTIMLGSEARSQDFAPKLQGGVQRKSSNSSEFKSRTPVQRGQSKSAF